MSGTSSNHSARYGRFVEQVKRYRARWILERLRPWVREGDRVLNVGAGDCRLDQLIIKRCGCEVLSVDVVDFNETELPLTIYDGRSLPYPASSFDVVLLIFVLHHCESPTEVLGESMRVSRRHVIAFEDVNHHLWDRWMFRGFHRFLESSHDIPFPCHEWSPEEWNQLAQQVGLREESRAPIGRQFGYFASRHVAFVWRA